MEEEIPIKETLIEELFKDSIGKPVTIDTGEVGVIDSVDEYGVVVKVIRPSLEWYDKKRIKLVE